MHAFVHVLVPNLQTIISIFAYCICFVPTFVQNVSKYEQIPVLKCVNIFVPVPYSNNEDRSIKMLVGIISWALYPLHRCFSLARRPKLKIFHLAKSKYKVGSQSLIRNNTGIMWLSAKLAKCYFSALLKTPGTLSPFFCRANKKDNAKAKGPP